MNLNGTNGFFSPINKSHFDIQRLGVTLGEGKLGKSQEVILIFRDVLGIWG